VLLALDSQPLHTYSDGDKDIHRQSMNVLEWWLAWCQTVPCSTQRIVRPALPWSPSPPRDPNTIQSPPLAHLLQIVRHFDGEDLLDAADFWEGGVAEVTTMVLHTDPGTGVRLCVVSCCSAS
jgi:hypothetical protein